MNIELVAIALLAFVGAFVGINFGGSMIFVSPALLALGYAPATIVGSSRPAILAQGLIGIIVFRRWDSLSIKEKSSLFLAGMIGGSSGYGLLLLLANKSASILLLSCILVICFFLILKSKIDPDIELHSGYVAIPINHYLFYKSGFRYSFS